MGSKKKKYLIILNPFSGKGRARKAEKQIIKFFEKNALSYTIEHTKCAKDATQIAQKYAVSDYTHYVIGGGDGTLNEVINGLNVSQEKTLIFLPLGTVNIFAREANIPKKIGAALSLILNGTPKRIKLGKCGNKRFILMLSAGLDSYVIQHVTPTLKKRLGILSYYFVFLKSIFTYNYPTIKIQVENMIYEGSFVLVSKCKYYAGFLHITPTAHLEDDIFNICILREKGFFAIFKFLAMVLLKLNHLNKDCVYLRSKAVKIWGAELASQIDGEPGNKLPLDIFVGMNEVKFLS